MSDEAVIVNCGHPELGTVRVRVDAEQHDDTVTRLQRDAEASMERLAVQAEADRAQREGERLAGEAAASKAINERSAKLAELRQRAEVNPDIRLIMEVLGL